MLFKFFLRGLLIVGSLPAICGENMDQLPIYNENSIKVADDWLVKKISQKSDLYRSKNQKELILSNGLISRRILISPNAGTISFKHLVTGEEFLRAVRPEALITIDGKKYKVGGLDGQPGQAFLKEEWVDLLTTNPNDFQYVGFDSGETKAPFKWKKRPKWMRGDLPWPAPGKSLTLHFKMMNSPKPGPLEKGRSGKLLFEDDFSDQSLKAGWQEILSPKCDRSSFQNEGKVGEIMTFSNCYAFAERKLPKGTSSIQCRIDPGTDNSDDWGPGMTTVWPNRSVKMYLDSAKKRLEIAVNGKKEFGHKIVKGKPYFVKQVFSNKKISFFSSTNQKNWRLIHEIKGDFKSPSLVRLGKMSFSGKAEDAERSGPRVRCVISDFKVFGSMENEKSKPIHAMSGITVSIRYEMFDGIPVISKQIFVKNESSKSVTLNKFTGEVLAVVEPESLVEKCDSWAKPNLLVICDMNFGGMNLKNANPAVSWDLDPQYKSQVNYSRGTPCLLQVAPPIGPQQEIKPGKTFEGFRVFELPQDSWDRERKGLARRRFFKTLSPWTTENPLMMHVRRSNVENVKSAIDQCAEVGFDMVVLSFGSGYQAESESSNYLEKFKKLTDYAHGKGITLGCYSLLASRRVEKGSNVVGVKPRFGNSPCLCSKWGNTYFDKMYKLFNKTGFDIFEHDGSYPGDACRATNHPGHKQYEDSQWNQYVKIKNLYRWMREKGIYLNIPDFYYLQGGSRCGMGYREVNWSLPRKQQEIHERQNIYDGTWNKSGSMGWMHVPLTEYQGGGAGATLEPLKDHLPDYKQRLYNNLSAGVTGVFRGNRLYDVDTTKQLVKGMVKWYRKYAKILDSDIIHLRRADGRDIDYLLHVNPSLKNKGMLMVYNPLAVDVVKTIKVPLYYTGLTKTALISQEDENPKEFKLKRDFSIDIKVEVKAYSTTWYVIK